MSIYKDRNVQVERVDMEFFSQRQDMIKLDVFSVTLSPHLPAMFALWWALYISSALICNSFDTFCSPCDTLVLSPLPILIKYLTVINETRLMLWLCPISRSADQNICQDVQNHCQKKIKTSLFCEPYHILNHFWKPLQNVKLHRTGDVSDVIVQKMFYFIHKNCHELNSRFIFCILG